MSISHIKQQLVDLNRAYFEGQIVYDEYSRKRGLTLDALFDDITVRDLPAPKTVTMQQTVVIKKDQSNIYIYLAIALLIVCLGLAATFLFNNVFLSSSSVVTSRSHEKENKQLQPVLTHAKKEALTRTDNKLIETPEK